MGGTNLPVAPSLTLPSVPHQISGLLCPEHSLVCALPQLRCSRWLMWPDCPGQARLRARVSTSSLSLFLGGEGVPVDWENPVQRDGPARGASTCPVLAGEGDVCVFFSSGPRNRSHTGNCKAPSSPGGTGRHQPSCSSGFSDTPASRGLSYQGKGNGRWTQVPILIRLPAVWPWGSYFTSLSLFSQRKLPQAVVIKIK